MHTWLELRFHLKRNVHPRRCFDGQGCSVSISVWKKKKQQPTNVCLCLWQHVLFFCLDSSKKNTEKSSRNIPAVGRRLRGNIMLNRFGNTVKAPAERLSSLWNYQHLVSVSITQKVSSTERLVANTQIVCMHRSYTYEPLGEIILTFYSLKSEFRAWWWRAEQIPLFLH